MTAYIDRLEAMGACPEGIEWLRDAAHPDLPAAWAACPRADWMLWLAARTAEPGSPQHRAVVAAAADCAAEVLDLAPSGEARPRSAAEAAEAAAAAWAAWAADRAAAEAAEAAAAAWAAAYAFAAARAAGRGVDFAAIVRRHLPAPPTLPE